MKRQDFIKLMAFTIMASAMKPLAASAATPSAPSQKDGEIVGCTVRTAYEDVPFYSAGGIQQGSLKSNMRLTITGENADKFEVDLGGKIWLRKSDVLLNIKNYIPSLEIRLPMATGAIFKMADEDIPGLTGEVFYTNPGSQDGSEAWLKYEPAKKLLKAQQMFLQKGYGIIVYDAYRPFQDTVFFQKAYGLYLDAKPKGFEKTWFGNLSRSWFLAEKASSHNYGVAVDISLQNIETGEELVMPAPMHTLDKRSAYDEWGKGKGVASQNAMQLKQAMEQVGFTYLRSEYWHFQDNDEPRSEVVRIPN